MKKLLREDGPVLLVSLVITYLMFRAALGWDWNIIGAAVFAVVIGLISAVVIQALIVLLGHMRGGSSTDKEAGSAGARNAEPEDDVAGGVPEDGSSLDRGRDDHGDDSKPDWHKSFETDNPTEDDGSASGTGAEQSGPRGPVHRSEEYRSSLEDPD